jgi:hypothetical protein
VALIETLARLAPAGNAVNIACDPNAYGLTQERIHRHGLITHRQCVEDRIAFLDPHLAQVSDDGGI